MTDETFRRLTRAVRDADQLHQSTGGGTRHWLRECFLPALEEENLAILDLLSLDMPIDALDLALKNVRVELAEVEARIARAKVTS